MVLIIFDSVVKEICIQCVIQIDIQKDPDEL